MSVDIMGSQIWFEDGEEWADGGGPCGRSQEEILIEDRVSNASSGIWDGIWLDAGESWPTNCILLFIHNSIIPWGLKIQTRADSMS